MGSYPTPVRRVDTALGAPHELWIKDDGCTGASYGGNKVRKLERILAEAVRRGAKRIVTMGAVGSHHVLATTVYAQTVGLPVAAVLSPQPWSEHAERNIRAALGAGLQVHPTPSMATVPFSVARVLRRGDYLVSVGGSSTLGTLGYVDAVAELVEQIRAGELPEPEVLVTALGSGGTVAGLLAGVLREGLATRVVGVTVATPAWVSRPMVLGLAWRAARVARGNADFPRLNRALEVDGSELGRGYGWPTERGARATSLAAGAGLALEPTYTAKAFACALGLAGAEGFVSEFSGTYNRPKRVLYWHTLSSAPLQPLLEQGPEELPPSVAKLFLDG